MNFDLNAIILTEFGVGLDNRGKNPFAMIPVDINVQMALRDMAKETDRAMKNILASPVPYEPSEKYSAMEHLYLLLDDDMAKEIRLLHEATNLDIDTSVLSNPKDIFCYFAKFKDRSKRYLTAFRRASQFKGIVKNKSKLIRILDDSLRFIDDNIFKLDNDFDFLVDSENIYILRPSSFEFAGKLTAAILAAVPKNIALIKKELPFVDFERIAGYAKEHPRAARYLASIITKKAIGNIDKNLLLNKCTNTDVVVTEESGRLIVDKGSEMGFLEVLDRRRFDVELISGHPEKFRASSRTQL
jgi:hypothetical protein